jgi:hypothetical protein
MLEKFAGIRLGSGLLLLAALAAALGSWRPSGYLLRSHSLLPSGWSVSIGVSIELLPYCWPSRRFPAYSELCNVTAVLAATRIVGRAAKPAE